LKNFFTKLATVRKIQFFCQFHRQIHGWERGERCGVHLDKNQRDHREEPSRRSSGRRGRRRELMSSVRLRSDDLCNLFFPSSTLACTHFVMKATAPSRYPQIRLCIPPSSIYRVSICKVTEATSHPAVVLPPRSTTLSLPPRYSSAIAAALPSRSTSTLS
jgi:hypothetical protein